MGSAGCRCSGPAAGADVTKNGLDRLVPMSIEDEQLDGRYGRQKNV
jgi:hypothetical protein